MIACVLSRLLITASFTTFPIASCTGSVDAVMAEVTMLAIEAESLGFSIATATISLRRVSVSIICTALCTSAFDAMAFDVTSCTLSLSAMTVSTMDCSTSLRIGRPSVLPVSFFTACCSAFTDTESLTSACAMPSAWLSTSAVVTACSMSPSSTTVLAILLIATVSLSDPSAFKIVLSGSLNVVCRRVNVGDSLAWNSSFVGVRTIALGAVACGVDTSVSLLSAIIHSQRCASVNVMSPLVGVVSLSREMSDDEVCTASAKTLSTENDSNVWILATIRRSKIASDDDCVSMGSVSSDDAEELDALSVDSDDVLSKSFDDVEEFDGFSVDSDDALPDDFDDSEDSMLEDSEEDAVDDVGSDDDADSDVSRELVIDDDALSALLDVS